jgi:hexosaminidase
MRTAVVIAIAMPMAIGTAGVIALSLASAAVANAAAVPTTAPTPSAVARAVGGPLAPAPALFGHATLIKGSTPLIPAPAAAVPGRGAFALSETTEVFAPEGAEPERIARYFIDTLARTTPLRLKLAPTPPGSSSSAKAGPAISFELDATAAPGEAYSLDVTSKAIVIRAREPRGLFYGAVSLWQLATATPNPGLTISIAAVTINDAPRFAWRGLLLDVSRHFLPPDGVKQLIDQMALHKLNTFQWHLTDDQGWRIEIKKHPLLTQIGAWRVPAGAGPAADIDPATGKPRLYGGFYTQDQIRDIVRYAADRFITIVPEIEMPGHAQAAIAAYPQLGTEGPRPPVSSDWGVHTYLYNADESTFAFLEDVLTEVMELFPSPYIHTGGDEAAKDRWRASPRIQQRMRELGVANEAALQGYFTHRMEKFISAHGRKLIGWDEILEGGVPPAAAVMSWRGESGAIEASKAGHDVVMAPSPNLYLDYLQSNAADEPPGRPRYVTLEDMYRFAVVPKTLAGDAARHVIGAQINAWTEHMRSPERMQHAIFPRVAAFAENVWTGSSGDWQGFIARLPAQLARYEKLGIRYADSAFAVRIGSAKESGAGLFELSNQVAAGAIRYTFDGSAPTNQSRLYSTPLDLKLPVTLNAATFENGQRVSTPRSYVLNRAHALRRNSDELKSCSNKLPLRLEDDAPRNGPRAVFNVDILDPCWIYERADLSRASAISADIGQLPFNFQVGDDVKKIPLYPPTSVNGELEVRLDSCDGERIAVLPLAAATSTHAIAKLPPVKMTSRSGTHDLCLRFTRRAVDPIWAIDSVQIIE